MRGETLGPFVDLKAAPGEARNRVQARVILKTRALPLTGFRFVTFPRKWLEARLPRVQKEVGDQLIVAFDAAYRGAKGRLRRND